MCALCPPAFAPSACPSALPSAAFGVSPAPRVGCGDSPSTRRRPRRHAVTIELVFPKFKLLSGAERLILSLARALEERGHRLSILCHAFDPTCRPLAQGLTIRETGARLEWSGNHYLDSLAPYLLAARLRRAIAAD